MRTLCDILIKDNDGNIRLSEKLTDTDSYYNCYPHNTKGMWQDIAAELQRFGGNTFLNFYRHGRGPAYESIVLDVCKKMEVDDITEHDTTEEMELTSGLANVGTDPYQLVRQAKEYHTHERKSIWSRIQQNCRMAFYSHPQMVNRAYEIDSWKNSYNYKSLIRSLYEKGIC